MHTGAWRKTPGDPFFVPPGIGPREYNLGIKEFRNLGITNSDVPGFNSSIPKFAIPKFITKNALKFNLRIY
jgi:hypothetical protein